MLGKLPIRSFQSFFTFSEKLRTEGLPASQYGPRILQIENGTLTPNTGSGARKNGNTHFCHLCQCTGNYIASYLEEENQ
jgi:hypothetical protein